MLHHGIDESGLGYTLVGIGVDAANGYFLTGTIEDAPNLKWEGSIPLADILKKISSAPVLVSNDANTAAVDEMIFGVARGMKDFMVITLGTGLVCNGHVLNGKP